MGSQLGQAIVIEKTLHQEGKAWWPEQEARRSPGIHTQEAKGEEELGSGYKASEPPPSQ